ncbi:unnamed protein product [Rhizoctonia solani]|uniref:Protein kinase domain-containing protein n=1 Tax=Rhizoctonia solani TaxID=456999 RepID=A0A8H3DAN3_9AGAM|nr:unnamed protein product [Rhizoctonia solani]
MADSVTQASRRQGRINLLVVANPDGSSSDEDITTHSRPVNLRPSSLSTSHINVSGWRNSLEPRSTPPPPNPLEPILTQFVSKPYVTPKLPDGQINDDTDADADADTDVGSASRRQGRRRAIKLLVVANPDGSSSSDEDTPAAAPPRQATAKAPSPRRARSPSSTAYATASGSSARLSSSGPESTPLHLTLGLRLTEPTPKPHITPKLPDGEDNDNTDAGAELSQQRAAVQTPHRLPTPKPGHQSTPWRMKRRSSGSDTWDTNILVHPPRPPKPDIAYEREIAMATEERWIAKQDAKGPQSAHDDPELVHTNPNLAYQNRVGTSGYTGAESSSRYMPHSTPSIGSFPPNHNSISMRTQSHSTNARPSSDPQQSQALGWQQDPYRSRPSHSAKEPEAGGQPQSYQQQLYPQRRLSELYRPPPLTQTPQKTIPFPRYIDFAQQPHPQSANNMSPLSLRHGPRPTMQHLLSEQNRPLPSDLYRPPPLPRKPQCTTLPLTSDNHAASPSTSGAYTVGYAGHARDADSNQDSTTTTPESGTADADSESGSVEADDYHEMAATRRMAGTDGGPGTVTHSMPTASSRSVFQSVVPATNPQPAYVQPWSNIISRNFTAAVQEEDSESDEDNRILWQVPKQNMVPPMTGTDTTAGITATRFNGLWLHIDGSRPDSGPSPTQDSSWENRPQAEEVCETLDQLFPDHDLDKPVIDAHPGGTSFEPAEAPPMAGPITPLIGGLSVRRHKKSIRVVAAERKKTLERVNADITQRPPVDDSATIQPGTMGPGLNIQRKRSTKLWGGGVEEDTSGSVGQKPTFKWVKGQLIGQGRFGRVYHAMNLTTGEMIAAKQVELPKTDADSTDSRRMSVVNALKLESEILQDLDHPHIVQYLGFEETMDVFSLFMEYVPGGSLGSVLRKIGKFADEVVRSFSHQIIDGLAYLHKSGILHRDLKGDSILVSRSGMCKISDFTISKRSEHVYSNRKGTMIQGSVFWSAPEVLYNNEQGYSAKIDIWSVGCVFLEMQSGRHPWMGDDMSVVMHKVGQLRKAPPVPDDVTLSPLADDFRQKCFMIDPAERPTAAELLTHPWLQVPPRWVFTGFKESLVPSTTSTGTAGATNVPSLVWTKETPQSNTVSDILRKDIAYTSSMSIHEMFEYLTRSGCPDLTQSINPNGYSKRSIATGGFGDIFKGKLKDGTPVAIKVWRSRALHEELGKVGKRAMREIYNWSQLDHDNIQKLLGVIVFDERLGMISEWMERGNLQEYLQKNPNVDGYPLCVQVAQGVEYLHNRNMIHGDLKAINILVSPDHKLKLTDFDYSIMAESTVFSQTTRLGGGTLRLQN